MGTTKKDRLGEISKTNEGYEIKIVEYNRNDDIWVEFQDEYKVKVHTTYNNFKKGNVKNAYHPSVYNIGYIGIGKYKTGTSEKMLRVYSEWHSMLKRCYSEDFHKKEPTYISCEVCKEWLCFQNYAKWREDNYYECNNEGMQLDKDILVKGNKIYSPETCIFVPQRINVLFTKSNRKRGEYPIGVNYEKDGNKLVSYCSIFHDNKKKSIRLGYFSLNEPFKAFTTYKNFKENYIKKVADEYKELIPQKLYEALYKYEVEIND